MKPSLAWPTRLTHNPDDLGPWLDLKSQRPEGAIDPVKLGW
jgi:hypothetical protein